MGAGPAGAGSVAADTAFGFDETAKQAEAAKAAAVVAAQERAAEAEARKQQDAQMFAAAGPKRSGSSSYSSSDWAAPLPSSPAVADAMRGLSLSSASGHASSEPAAAAASSSLASSARFANAKGIGSDQLFGQDDEDPDARYQRQQKLAALSGARAISSDMYYGNGDGMGSDGMGSSPYSAESPGLNEAAELAAERARQLGQSVARGVGFLKAAGSDIFDSLRG